MLRYAPLEFHPRIFVHFAGCKGFGILTANCSIPYQLSKHGKPLHLRLMLNAKDMEQVSKAKALLPLCMPARCQNKSPQVEGFELSDSTSLPAASLRNRTPLLVKPHQAAWKMGDSNSTSNWTTRSTSPARVIFRHVDMEVNGVSFCDLSSCDSVAARKAGGMVPKMGMKIRSNDVHLSLDVCIYLQDPFLFL